MANINVSVRSQYCAEKGNILVAADLSQAESWIVAYLADEPNMKHSLHNSDIHRDTAGNALFFGEVGCAHEWNPPQGPATCKLCNNVVTKVMRYVGKRYNHASAYRMGYNRAAQVINKDSDKPPYVTVTFAESKQFSTRWHSYYNLKAWWADIERQLDSGRTLITPYDRSRIFYQAWGDELFKEATAYIPQSTVSDHCKGRVHSELGIEGGLKMIYKELIKPYYPQHKMVNESHDSCILEVPYALGPEILERTMGYLRRPLVVNGETFTIPVDGEIGERWGELRAA